MTQLDKLALKSLANKLGKMFVFGALSALLVYGLITAGIAIADIVMVVAFAFLGISLYNLLRIGFQIERGRIEREQDELIQNLKGDK